MITTRRMVRTPSPLPASDCVAWRPIRYQRTHADQSVLNDVWVSVPVGSESGTGHETSSFKHPRKNAHEELLFKVPLVARSSAPLYTVVPLVHAMYAFCGTACLLLLIGLPYGYFLCGWTA